MCVVVLPLQVRDLQNNFFGMFSTAAMAQYEKYNQENSDIESLPEEARILLQDKDALVNALQVRAGRGRWKAGMWSW